MSIRVSVVGSIGAGKSSFIRALNKDLAQTKNVEMVLEPTKKWTETGLLQLFYSDPVKYAFFFQTTIYDDLVDQMRAAMRENPDIVLAERGMQCAKLFWSLQEKTDLENTTYLNMWAKWKDLIPEPTHYIFLDTDNIDELMRRVAQRNRDGEGGVSREYQEKLVKAHREVYNKDKMENLIVLDALDTVEANVEKIKKLLF
jgi:deoxyadenosine/deoxycytidine kinase